MISASVEPACIGASQELAPLIQPPEVSKSAFCPLAVSKSRYTSASLPKCVCQRVPTVNAANWTRFGGYNYLGQEIALQFPIALRGPREPKSLSKQPSNRCRQRRVGNRIIL